MAVHSLHVRDTGNATIYCLFYCFFCWSAELWSKLFYLCKSKFTTYILYCYYSKNRISNSLFRLWTFNLNLITTSTNLQNKFYFIFLNKLNNEANLLVHFIVNITNKKHVLNKSRCGASLSFRMFISCGRTTCLSEISVLVAFFCLRRL